MKIDTSIKSPNYSERQIDVRFAVLHYTAVSLKKTLDIFSSKSSQVSSHFVVGCAGEIFELVPCLEMNSPTGAYRAWHAGVSSFVDDSGTSYDGLNDFSIGIEMENLNGNLFEYTDAQYQALSFLLARLQKKYPALEHPSSIIGHEDIAGTRGKVDPGHRFDWRRFFGDCYPGQPAPERLPVLPDSVREKIDDLAQFAPADPAKQSDFFASLSSLCETSVAEIFKGQQTPDS